MSEQETWLAETTVRLHFHSSGYGLWMPRLDRTDHSWVAGHQGTMFIQYLQLLRVPFGVVLIALTEAEKEVPWLVFLLVLWRVAEVTPRSHYWARPRRFWRKDCVLRTEAPFRCEIFWLLAIAALSFVFDQMKALFSAEYQTKCW